MGKYSLMSTIPMKWVKRNNLKSGDQINFVEVNNKLILSSEAEIFKKKIEVHISSTKVEVIWRVLQPIYTSGYDEAIITFTDKKTLKILERSLQSLIAFEIVETGENRIVIKSVAHHSDEDFNAILRRTFLIFLNISEVFKEGLEKNKIKRLEEIRPLEITVNKYTMFLKRLINRKGYKYPHYMYSIVTFLELASNHFEYLRRYFSFNPKTKIEKEMIEDSRKLNDLINRTYDLNYKFSEKKFEKIAVDQPHFLWFKGIKNSEIKSNFKSIAEYIVQISRLIKANNM